MVMVGGASTYDIEEAVVRGNFGSREERSNPISNERLRGGLVVRAGLSVPVGFVKAEEANNDCEAGKPHAPPVRVCP
jgi:hypothetical protein